MTTHRATARLADAAWPALLALSAGWLMCWDLYLPHAAYDDGIRATGAFLIREGRIPYRDFYCIYGFGEFYLGAGLLAVFGHSLTALRAARIVSQVGLACAAYGLARRLSGSRAAGLLAGALTVPLIGGNCNWALIAVLASLGALHAHLRWQSARRWRLWLCGVLLGVAAWFRPDMAAFAGIGELAALLIVARAPSPVAGAGSRPLRLAIVQWLGAAVGAGLLGYGPFLILCPGDLWRGLIEIPWISMPGRRLPFPGPAVALFSMFWAHVVIALAAAAWLLSQLRISGRFDADRSAAAATCLTCMLTWAYAGGRSDPQHQMPSLTLACVLAGWLIVDWLRSLASWKAAASVAALGIYVWMSIAPLDGILRLADAARWAGAAPRCALPAAGTVRFENDSDQIRAATFVRGAIPGERTLYVGLLRHDQVFVNDAMFYFLVQKRPAVRDFHFDPLVTNSAPVQHRMIADLEQARPTLAVLWRDGSFSREPNASATSSGVLLLDRYLSEQYEPLATFGAYEVRRRKSSTGPAD